MSITNVSSMNVGPLTTSLTGSDRFTKSPDGCDTLFALEPNDGCFIIVKFSPTAEAAVNGTLTVSAPNVPSVTASLTGTGSNAGPADLEMTPDPLAFGSVPVAGGTLEKTFTITNTGGSISGDIGFSPDGGPNGGDFQPAANNCIGPLEQLLPAQSCTYVMRFDPSGLGMRSAAWTVADSTGSADTAQMTGTGT